jgi:hypothetical protein
MGDNQRVDDSKRLRGRSNFLSWLTAITVLLCSLPPTPCIHICSL